MSGGGASPGRMLALWWPDWPARAAGLDAGTAAAVIAAERVVATTPAAADAGVRVGHRRREAQVLCPALTVIAADTDRDARAFAPVVAAVEALAPGLEVVRPGLCVLAVRGPARYFGGESVAAARLLAVAGAVTSLDGSVVARDGRAGIAEGAGAATLAARRAGDAPLVVPAGGTPAFLAGLPIDALDEVGERWRSTAAKGPRSDLVDLLARLGLTRLGAFADLDEADVLARFGHEGQSAHRLAAGVETAPVAARLPPPDADVTVELDPPAETVTAAAFAARTAAEQLAEQLAGHGQLATRVTVLAETEHGERSRRSWRTPELVAGGGWIAERVRWQLDGWLTSGGEQQPTAPVSRLVLTADDVAPVTGRQPGFWGGAAAATERAGRALARVQGLCGVEAVLVAERVGGRGPGEQVRLLPWGEGTACRIGPGDRSMAAHKEAPWPGRLPAPSPAVVHPVPPAVALRDDGGEVVRVDGRGLPTAAPAQLLTGEGTAVAIVAWAGPWPADERWWDPATHRRRARLQVVDADGQAWLLACEAGRWHLEAAYT